MSTFLGSSVPSRPVPSLPPLFLPLPLLPFPSPSLPLALPLSSSPRLLACLPVRERRRRCRYAASFRGFEQLIDPDAGMDSYMSISCAPFEQRRAGSSLRLQVDFKLANCAYVSDRTHSLTQSSCAIIARSRRVVALRITSRAPAAECLRPRAHIHTRLHWPGQRVRGVRGCIERNIWFRRSLLTRYPAAHGFDSCQVQTRGTCTIGHCTDFGELVPVVTGVSRVSYLLAHGSLR